MAWISLAALVNAVGGTVRQIVWLGLLVMVPCTLWLLRKSRRVLVAGCSSWIIGVVFVAAATHWLARQPYSLQRSLVPDRIYWRALIPLGGLALRSAGQLALLALPVLLMFSGSLRLWNRRAAVVFGIGFLCFVVWGVALIRARELYLLDAPFILDYMTATAFDRLSISGSQGLHLAVPRRSLHMLLIGAVVFGLLCLASSVFAGTRGRKSSPQKTAAISWQKLGILLGSSSAAYIVILALTSLQKALFDRYLLPLLAILLLVLARYYQEKVKANLPWACALLILIFGSFSIAATHDEFALYRGFVSAADEIRSSGAPATAIAGLWEFEGWTQIEKAGYVNKQGIQIPKGAYVPQVLHAHRLNCSIYPSVLDMVPAINPAYVVSSDPGDCGGQVAFPPVAYRTWIAPHTNWIYAVKLPPDFSR